MTTTEVEWDEDTRTAALALEQYRRTLCESCGRPRSVCQSAENEFAFEADGPYRCHAATVVIDARERMGEDVHAPAALTFNARLKDGAGR